MQNQNNEIFSNKLNSRSCINMLTIHAKFCSNGEIKSLCLHVFQHQKDPYGSWQTGRNFLINELNNLGFKFKRLVKVILLMKVSMVTFMSKNPLFLFEIIYLF